MRKFSNLNKLRLITIECVCVFPTSMFLLRWKVYQNIWMDHNDMNGFRDKGREILFRLVFYIRRQRNLNGSFVFNVQAINIYHLFSFSVISQMMGILVRFCYQMLHLLRAPFTWFFNYSIEQPRPMILALRMTFGNSHVLRCFCTNKLLIDCASNGL